MRRLTLILAVLLSVSLFADDASARGRLFRRRTSYATASVTYSGGPQAVASAKASRMAARGIRGHQGGGFGGANAEGVGWGLSASAALSNCCYTGQRRVAGSAVVRGVGGMYYAVKLYW